MHVHIIGICGTFMGGVARLARELGHVVTGSDANTYPPMSTQLEGLGIELTEGFNAKNVPDEADIILVGNAISRGNAELEHVLDKGLKFTSGAQWLHEYVLQGRWVLAVAGTHGKTTTSSLLAWILQDNGLAPGYLIGGVPENFGETARLGETPFFVIEADEYDTAFSDKRSKFVHYSPRTLVINNLEFDHADIFTNLEAIQTQFHHLLKIVPTSGQVIYNQDSSAIKGVLEKGVWSEAKSFGKQGDWQVQKITEPADQFEVIYQQQSHVVTWPIIGDHNMMNAIAAIAAAHHVGIPIGNACESLATFRSVKRRLEKIYNSDGITVFDDFAHHPTAISETINALRSQVGTDKIIAVLEPRSNTMKQGVHKHLIADALQSANNAMIYNNDQVLWDINELTNGRIKAYSTTQALLDDILVAVNNARENRDKCHIVIMSNGGFDGLHQRLLKLLSN